MYILFRYSEERKEQEYAFNWVSRHVNKILSEHALRIDGWVSRVCLTKIENRVSNYSDKKLPQEGNYYDKRRWNLILVKEGIFYVGRKANENASTITIIVISQTKTIIASLVLHIQPPHTQKTYRKITSSKKIERWNTFNIVYLVHQLKFNIKVYLNFWTYLFSWMLLQIKLEAYFFS